MKTLVTLNIGMMDKNEKRVNVHEALHAIGACGLSITTSAIVQGEWEGKPEQTLFIQGFCDAPHSIEFRARLYLACGILSQHCIAVYVDGKGELIGDTEWKFDTALFHFHPEGKAPALSPCQAVQAKHAAKRAQVEKESFCAFLRDTLIPDLKEAGMEATAQDFETCLYYIRG